LDGTRAILGVRPFEAPLHRREWRTRTVPGSLHPPVAAAMTRLADIRPGHVVLDPFCGAGTMLLEAAEAYIAARFIGIDRSDAALEAARANSAGRPGMHWHRGDAARLTGFASSADRIVTNPPWGVRQAIADIAPYIEQWRVALKPGGTVVAILNPQQAEVFIQTPGWTALRDLEVSVAGRPARIVCAAPGLSAGSRREVTR
jgi:23S rRNA G2445 N2-methylase RlmL